MHALNDQQRRRLSVEIARLGVAPIQSNVDTTIAQSKKEAPRQHIVLSSDPLESDVPPHIIAVGSIAELNRMAGAPDDGDDAHVQYPPAPPLTLKALAGAQTSEAALSGDMDGTMLHQVRMAATAYLMGNPAKVADYEHLINSVMFPGKVAAFVYENLSIPAGGTLTLQGPGRIMLICGKITVGENGQIVILSDAHISTQILDTTATLNVLQSVPTFTITSQDYASPAPAGANGHAGYIGATGHAGFSHYTRQWICLTPPGDGKTGGTGGTGDAGARGADGLPGVSCALMLGDITGNVSIQANGGNGQKGGAGGSGGNGGPGGPAGSNAEGCAAAKTGSQGTGGAGGDGGQGGNGGNGSVVMVYYNSCNGQITHNATPGKPGPGGDLGAGGAGSPPGVPGKPGSPGFPGSAPVIRVIPQ